jgi:hypothetical protein
LWKERVVCSICHERLEDQQLIFRAFGKAVPGVGWRAAQPATALSIDHRFAARK